MVAEALAVVRMKENDRIVALFALPEVIEQPPHLHIDEVDHGVIGSLDEPVVARGHVIIGKAARLAVSAAMIPPDER